MSKIIYPGSIVSANRVTPSFALASGFWRLPDLLQARQSGNWPSTIIVDGLVGWWRLDEGTGTTASDTSGFGRNGTLVNSPTWVDGEIGKALAFNGTNQYVTVGDANDFSITTTGSMTWCGWVRRGIDDSEWLSKGAGSGSFEYFITSQGVAQILPLTASPGWNTVDFSGYIPGPGVWHHVCVTYSASMIYAYVNGVQVASVVPAYTLGNGTAPLEFARRSDVARYTDATLDDIRIYNRALTAQEIFRIANIIG